MLALFILKLRVTALCLNSGASGGLFTPIMSAGAVLGGALGLLWSHAWLGSRLGVRHDWRIDAAPLAGLALVLEPDTTAASSSWFR